MLKNIVYLTRCRIPTEKAHGVQITKMCEAFSSEGVNVTLLHPRRRQPRPELEDQDAFDYYGISRSFHMKCLRNWDVMGLSKRLPRLMFRYVYNFHALIWGIYALIVARKERPDIYYTREVALAFLLVTLNLPTVLEVHGLTRQKTRLLRWIMRRGNLRLIIALTSHIKNQIDSLGKRSSELIWLPDCVDIDAFESLPDTEHCRGKLGLPQHQLIIGYVGRFRLDKHERGVPELIKAMSYLPEYIKAQALLLCVGGPMDPVPEYRRLARSHGILEEQVRFIDRVPNREVGYWINSCDVVTIPWAWSRHLAYYASPLKLFEYMAAGVPIVASDLPSLRDVLCHGENGWLVEPGNPKALAEGLSTVLSDGVLAQQLRARAKRDVQEYTWENRAITIRDHLDSNMQYF